MNQTPNILFEQITSCIESELTAFKKAYANRFDGEMNDMLSNYRPARGKHLRPILFFLVQGLYEKPIRNSTSLAVMIELIHDASLVHDDVIDESDLRRGIPTLHTKNGNHLAVLFGDYLFADALILGSQYNNIKVMELISGAVLTLSKGAIRELTQILNVEQERYLKIIREKTADFFGVVSEIAAIIQNPDQNEMAELRAFGEYFGMAFQIHDDILDFSGSSELLKKPVNADLSNGILTLPLIIALENLTREEKETAFALIESDDVQKFSWIQKVIQKHNGIEKAKQLADHYVNKAYDILNKFPDSPYKKSLELLMEYEQCRLS